MTDIDFLKKIKAYIESSEPIMDNYSEGRGFDQILADGDVDDIYLEVVSRLYTLDSKCQTQ